MSGVHFDSFQGGSCTNAETVRRSPTSASRLLIAFNKAQLRTKFMFVAPKGDQRALSSYTMCSHNLDSHVTKRYRRWGNHRGRLDTYGYVPFFYFNETSKIDSKVCIRIQTSHSNPFGMTFCRVHSLRNVVVGRLQPVFEHCSSASFEEDPCCRCCKAEDLL